MSAAPARLQNSTASRWRRSELSVALAASATRRSGCGSPGSLPSVVALRPSWPSWPICCPTSSVFAAPHVGGSTTKSPGAGGGASGLASRTILIAHVYSRTALSYCPERYAALPAALRSSAARATCTSSASAARLLLPPSLLLLPLPWRPRAALCSLDVP
eukprot:303776-Chlamydomonas_euryale.AAC.1